ncbi:MAG: hypothetical protein WD604_09140 [Balneolaceae bacterium]
MKLTERQNKLLEFVKQEHGDQQRKYSDEPYWHHLVRVAETTHKYLGEGIEIALCHDLLEDTGCTEKQLYKQLTETGYSTKEASEITHGVRELTDVFIKKDYPDLNRRARKKREAERLGKTSYLAQSIKYADLIDNTSSIVNGDSGFARVYINEAIDILDQMRAGNIHLLIECCYAVYKAKKKF